MNTVAYMLQHDEPWFTATDEFAFDDGTFTIEVTDELELGAVEDEGIGDEAADPSPDNLPDAFDDLVRAMEGAAFAMGAPPAAARQLRALLGVERIDSGLFGEAVRAALTTGGFVAVSDSGVVVRSAALTAQAGAWTDILRGTSEDYDQCGGLTLDVWAASLVACVAADRTRADGARRELRGRGVAAFGLVKAA